MSWSDKRGFSLIELLVVIAILGLLAGLIIPAVQSARESARRVGCLNNMKQLGIGLSSYHDAKGCFPEANNGLGYSLHCMLLPYIGEEAVYNGINFIGAPTNDYSSNLTVYQVCISEFFCPSEAGFRSRGTNYAGSLGVPGPELETMPREGANGVFAIRFPYPGPDVPVHYSEITDGTSHTVALSE